MSSSYVRSDSDSCFGILRWFELGSDLVQTRVHDFRVKSRVWSASVNYSVRVKRFGSDGSVDSDKLSQLRESTQLTRSTQSTDGQR
ncbi:hypothetical protein Hanom_Chr03g00235711 [Helianthus anomalus]